MHRENGGDATTNSGVGKAIARRAERRKIEKGNGTYVNRGKGK